MIDRIVGNKVIGIKQCTKTIKNGNGYVLYVAKDADKNLTKDLIELAIKENVKIVFINTMKELGKMCEIDVSASSVLVLD
ncbi:MULTISPECIES: ribosomal L7Ae/L30e/S12e/Gadd45 family protein [Clostridium]|jgi:large subunit ribosomal protein L7A|nr:MULTISPECIES: ribosomal L7Ae/L30e/S12e/Gadd45 family protein [Clostridium]KLE17392.1 ribosomal protein L7Ae-like protein [Clostridium sp. C8]